MKGGKYQILCVDDDQDILQTLRMILEKNGYDAVQASSAEDGYKKYQEVTPDFVLVDLMMEQIDSGTNLVTKIKALGCKAPIYMLSSMGDENVADDQRQQAGPRRRVPEADRPQDLGRHPQGQAEVVARPRTAPD
ncbi:MAG: response regulator [Myxococcales bacterium]